MPPSRPPFVIPIRGRPSWSSTTMRSIGPGAAAKNGSQTTAAPPATPATSRTVAARPAATRCQRTRTATGATDQIFRPRVRPSSTPASTVARPVAPLAAPHRAVRGRSRSRAPSTRGRPQRLDRGPRLPVGRREPDRVEQAADHGGDPPEPPRQERDEHRVGGPQRHEGEPGDGVAGGVGGEPSEQGERRERQQDAWRVQEHEVGVRDAPGHQRRGPGVVDAVVVRPQAQQSTTAQHRQQPGEEGQDRERDVRRHAQRAPLTDGALRDGRSSQPRHGAEATRGCCARLLYPDAVPRRQCPGLRRSVASSRDDGGSGRSGGTRPFPSYAGPSAA